MTVQHTASSGSSNSALAATSVAAGPFAAQSQTVPATPPKSSEVEEVVVTAQKRSESVVNVPISVVALSGVALKKAGIRDIRSLTEVVPALRRRIVAMWET